MEQWSNVAVFAMLTLALTVGTYLLGLALIMFVVMQRKDPTATLAWILIIVTLPIVGAILFLWFGYGRIAYRVERRQRSNAAIADQLEKIERTLIEYKILPEERMDVPVQSKLVKVTEGADAFSVTQGNRFRLITEPEDVFAQLELAIENARDSIHMEYYIFRRDKTGKRIRDLLIAAAKRGVEARLLVDGVGSWTIGDAFTRPLRQAGAKFARYLPVTFLGRPWHWNLRNHRKITVVDGTIGYVGSVNIGDDYRKRRGRTDDFYDYQIACEGPVVQQLQEVFAGDWFFATRENLLKERYFPLPERSGAAAGQVVSSGPDEPRHTLHEMLCAAIHAAEDSVRIVTPYLIPDQALIVALRTAALRGVKVQIILPHTVQRRPLQKITFHAGRSYYEDLLGYGIEIHEYLPGFLHAKGIVVDGAWASVGTTNFDIRSFRLNFEVNVNFYSREMAQLLERSFEAHLRLCRNITPETLAQRPFGMRCLENTMRVFSPIL